MLVRLVGLVLLYALGLSSLAMEQKEDCEGKGVMTPLQKQIKLSNALVNKTFFFDFESRLNLCRMIRSVIPSAAENTEIVVNQIAKKYNMTTSQVVNDYVYDFICQNGKSMLRTSLDGNFFTLEGLFDAGMDPNTLIMGDDGNYTTLVSLAFERYKRTKERKWKDAVRMFRAFGGKKCEKLKPNPCIN